MKKWLFVSCSLALCAALALTGCSRKSDAVPPTQSSVAPASESAPSSEASEPENAEILGPCVRINGVRYLLTEQTEGWTEGVFAPIATITAVVGQPARDGEASFGAVGDTLYRQKDPSMPDDVALFWREENSLRRLFPTQTMVALDRALTAEEQLYADNVAALVAALEQKDAAALSALMQADSRVTTIYQGPLAATELTVLQTVYISDAAAKFYGVYSAWIDVEVTRSTVLPLGRQRLTASFRNDPRKGHPAGTLPLGALTIEESQSSTYPQIDAEQFGWNEVSDMVTLRIDMPFHRPEEISPRLLLRTVVPYAYRRAVWEDGGAAGPLTPERVAAAAELLYGIQGFSCEDADYFDAASGNYTLANHNRVTAGMGHAMDYIDPGLNFSFIYGDGPDGFRYVTIVHYADPLQLMAARKLEYKVEKVTDELTGETVGRVLSAREIR
ncbi:MAG: hypothetical protein RR197_00635 [Oscillospiraceae bacterium]